MGYMHIDNLYKNQTILMFKECYALEKVHGTSAHIRWKDSKVSFFSGGAKYSNFVALFNKDGLVERFAAVGSDDVVIYGEAYGGKMQGMKETYGDKLRFIVFDVKIGGMWLDVPNMEQVAMSMGLDVIPWCQSSTDIEELDAERDSFSVVGRRQGNPGKKREGVVLRPLIELTRNNGKRIIAKHKRDDFSETKTPRSMDPEKLVVLTKANEIAQEWVTPMRLTHVLDSIGGNVQMEQMGDLIKTMLADVEREAEGEVIMSKTARKAIGSLTAKMFKARLQEALHNGL